MIEASLAVTSACLDKNVARCTWFRRLLVKVRGQRKDLVEAEVVLCETKARATKTKKVLSEAMAKGAGADARVTNVEAKVTES